MPDVNPAMLFPIFVRVLRVISELGEPFNAKSLLSLIVSEPVLLYSMGCDQIPAISWRELPPLSLLAHSDDVEVTLGMLVMYRPIVLRILELILYFQSESVAAELFDDMICAAQNVFNAVTCGPAGRDAFSLVLRYCQRDPLLSPYLTNFLAFCRSGTNHRARSITMATVLSAFDTELYPSVIDLMKQKKDLILDLLTTINDSIDDSPVQLKAIRLKRMFGGELEETDILTAANKMILTLARGGPVPHNIMDVIAFCAGRLFRLEYFCAFSQLVSLAFEKIERCVVNANSIALLAGYLLPLFNHVPQWHVLNLWKHRALMALYHSTSHAGLRLILQEKIGPISDFGACLLIGECVVPYPDKAYALAEAYPDILSTMVERLAVSELVCASKLLCKVFRRLPNLPDAALASIKSTIIVAPERGWRNFIRLAAPVLQFEQFVNYLFEDTGIEMLLMQIVKMLNGLDGQDIFSSKSLVLLWKTIGSHPGAGGVAEPLSDIVRRSACLTFKSEQEAMYFYDAFYDVVVNIGRGFLAYFAHPLLHVDDCLMAFLLKLPSDVAMAYTNDYCPPLAHVTIPTREQGVRVRTSPVPWPESDWLPEVTGVAYHNRK